MRVRGGGECRRAVHGRGPARCAGKGASEASVERRQRAADAAGGRRIAAARGFCLRVFVRQPHARRGAPSVRRRRACARRPHLRLMRQLAAGAEVRPATVAAPVRGAAASTSATEHSGRLLAEQKDDDKVLKLLIIGCCFGITKQKGICFCTRKGRYLEQ